MSTERLFDKEIASLDPMFGFLEEFYAREGIAGKTCFALSLVVEELFTNLVKYNAAGCNPILVRLGRSGDWVNLQLVDRDVEAFDPATLPEVDVDAPLAQRSPGGLGLHLVRAIVDRVSFDYRDRVMTITVDKKLEPADA